MTDELPEGMVIREGKKFRRIVKVAADGEEREVFLPVADSLEEAKLLRMEYYHPELGWIHEGYKLVKDRSAESIMADNTVATPLPVEKQERRRAAILGEASE